jgi:hypothetical protein
MSKIYDVSYKFKYMDAADIVNLTYFLIKFVDVLEFILCVVIYIKHLLSMFSIQNDEVPVLFSDMSHAGNCFLAKSCVHNTFLKNLDNRWHMTKFYFIIHQNHNITASTFLYFIYIYSSHNLF